MLHDGWEFGHRLFGIMRRREFFLQQVAGRMGIGSTAMVLLSCCCLYGERSRSG